MKKDYNCKTCGEIDNNKFYGSNKTRCVKCYSRLYVERSRGIRDETIALLGGSCKCGVSDRRALQIDHVNDNGAKERSSFTSKSKYYSTVLDNIRNGSNDYQILCANCNAIKEYERRQV